MKAKPRSVFLGTPSLVAPNFGGLVFGMVLVEIERPVMPVRFNFLGWLLNYTSPAFASYSSECSHSAYAKHFSNRTK